MSTKRCTRCGQDKPIADFYVEYVKPDGTPLRRGRCKQCVADRAHEWREQHPVQRKETSLRHYQKRRFQALLHYSNGAMQCACCGEDKAEFLVIDHVNDDGAQHRREIGRTRTLFQWLYKQDYPPGFQVLCHNCNFAKSAYGQCPHEAERLGTYEPPDVDKIAHYRKRARRRLITFDGRTQSVQEWAEETGISRSCISLRLDRYGWSVERTLTTPSHPSRNKRTTLTYTFQGETLTLAEWAKRTGISRHVLWHRIRRAGWSVHDALTKPVRRRKT